MYVDFIILYARFAFPNALMAYQPAGDLATLLSMMT